MEKTVQQWLEELEKIESGVEYRLMEQWDSETSVEIYAHNDSLASGLVGADKVDDWNKQYSDEDGAKWLLHLYAYWDSGKIKYDGVLYDDVELGTNNWEVLHIEENLRVALDIKVTQYMNKRGYF